MEGILNSFLSIINILKTAWNLIINFFTHIGDLYQMSATATNTAMQIINTLPIQIQYFALMTLLVSILFLVLGRTGGKS